ncbi:MAG: pstS4 [Nitrospira sp.]|jgi:phosphate transport system substrate-binding protein|nr:pstS4 [Nitrospira sp.]
MAKWKCKSAKKRWATMLLVMTAGTAGIAFAETPLSTRPVVDSTIAPYTSTAQELSGRLAIVGSDTMKPLLVKLASAFSRLEPDTSIAVEGGGSKQAIRQFLVGYTSQRRGEKARTGHDGSALPSILASSRELTVDELKNFRSRYGHDPIVMPIALDAVTIFVHRDNPIRGLTLDQVDAIFSVTRKRGLPEDIRSWGQLGLQEKWNDQPIHLHGRNEDSGTHDFFVQTALLGGKLKEEIKEAPGSASEILAIANDPTAIGYAGIGFKSSYVRPVPIATKAEIPYVEPTGQAVVNNSYPLSRALYLYINADPKEKLDPLVAEFLRFANSQEGQDIVVKAQYYPLTPILVAQNLKLINGATLTAALLPK